MSRKTATILGVAAVAIATTLFPSGRDAAALAQSGAFQPDTALAPEATALIPELPQFVSEPVVQPLPVEAAEPKPDPASARSLAELVRSIDTATDMSAEMRCLAGAVYFEARGEPLAGQLAVAEVIVNRSEDGRFPRSYCGVVTQPGQFSFVRGRRIPQAREGSPAWARAVAIARIAHDAMWKSEAEDAVFFHAQYVKPGWSRTKTRLAQIDTHIFYR